MNGRADMRHRCSRDAADASYGSHGGPGTAGAADQRVAYGPALRAAAALRMHHLMRPSGAVIVHSCTRMMRTLAAASLDWPGTLGAEGTDAEQVELPAPTLAEEGQSTAAAVAKDPAMVAEALQLLNAVDLSYLYVSHVLTHPLSPSPRNPSDSLHARK
jgi:hypothetical protein